MKRREPWELNRYFARVPTPTAAILELTNRCNLECVHCLRESPASWEWRRPDELNTADWMAVLDDLAELKTFSVCFTGGEATTFPDLMPLIEHARARRMNVTLKTNGLLLDRLAPRLAAAGVGLIEVSLYGATAATHDRTTEHPGSFDRTIAGIRAARAVGIPVTVNSTLFRWNAHEAAAIRRLVTDLDALAMRDYFLTTSDRGRSFADAFLTPAQIREVENVWPGCTVPKNQNGFDTVKVCAQGTNTVAVTAAGEILSCVTIRKSLGHVKREGLVATWNKLMGNHGVPRQRAHAIDYARFHRCTECEFLPKCTVCIGQNLAATGDFYEPPLERCYITLSLYGQERLRKEMTA